MINNIFKPSSLIGIFALIISSALLFEIKYSVQAINKELQKVEIQILKVKEDIHILKAEYSYVTKPEYLLKLSKKYLDLDIVEPKKIKSVNLDKLEEIFSGEGIE